MVSKPRSERLKKSLGRDFKTNILRKLGKKSEPKLAEKILNEVGKVKCRNSKTSAALTRISWEDSKQKTINFDPK